jgi:DNA polymerase I-like protein with 3'-5' exonuclease and polymerase domains
VDDEILLECPIDIANQTAEILEKIMVEKAEAYLYPIPVEV